jgi:multiple sugar transport system ATP-binding protein
MSSVSFQHVSINLPAGALDDFSIDVPDRELLVLAGPEDSGASTALRAIAGLQPAASGEILIAEKRVDNLPATERDIAMIFRDDALYPAMTVQENMAFALKRRKFPEAEIKRRVAEAASLLGLEEILGRKPSGLTPIARRQVSLARAVARQPKVFLFDDPLAGLEPALRAELRAQIIRLHHEVQATFIYATSDQADALAMAQRMALLNHGSIRQTGDPLTLYRQPADTFVAAFLGHPRMNFIRGKMRGTTFKESGDGVIEIDLAGNIEAASSAGREVIAGIRPEEIGITPLSPGKPGPLQFRALLDVVELQGSRANYHLDTGSHKLIARAAPPESADEAGHRIQFRLDPAQIHLFDPGTTKRLSAERGSALSTD